MKNNRLRLIIFLFLSSFFLAPNFVTNISAQTTPAQLDFYTQGASQGLPGVDGGTALQADRGFGRYLSVILGAVMTISALLLLLFLVWGAIEWITSGGDSGKLQKARDKIIQAIIGLLVLASSLAIYLAIQAFLGVQTVTVIP